MFDLIVVGGGAAGVFAAISAKEINSQVSVLLLEKTKYALSKVRISGGGRCNVTHACFDPFHLAKHYPRGSKELIGPFSRFGPKETIAWFESKAVELKTEADGRIFPVTDNSETIIECLLSAAAKLNIEIHYREAPTAITKIEEGYALQFKDKEQITCKNLLLATGSNVEGFKFAESLGHTIQSPVPSLFTFNVPTSSLLHLSGLKVENVKLTLENSPLEEKGILLLTHFGFSGPAVLRLSAWGARLLHERDYRLTLFIDWTFPLNQEECFKKLEDLKKSASQKQLSSENPFNLPKNLWKFLIERENLSHLKICDISLKELRKFSEILHKDQYQIEGKTTNKEEFVTCGGITLKEVDFKTLESKISPGLYFAGEILDIDGITGGFNFQNAWTTGFLAGKAIANSIKKF